MLAIRDSSSGNFVDAHFGRGTLARSMVLPREVRLHPLPEGWRALEDTLDLILLFKDARDRGAATPVGLMLPYQNVYDQRVQPRSQLQMFTSAQVLDLLGDVGRVDRGAVPQAFGLARGPSCKVGVVVRGDRALAHETIVARPA